MAVAKREPRPSTVQMGGVSGTLIWPRAMLRGLRFANSRACPKVPHGTSCSLLTRHHAQTPAVLDHSRALPQGDGKPGPSFCLAAVGALTRPALCVICALG